MADAGELEGIYALKVTPVPTALPVARRDYPDVAFKSRKAANDALVREVQAAGGGKSDGRPCLIGTTSVAQSEQIVASLEERGIKTELLNALPANAARESEIVAQAGRAGVVTVATNMAGRGTDILLGGCPSTMARIKVRSILAEQGVISKEESATLPPTPPDDYFPCSLDEDLTLALKDAASSIKKAVGTSMTALDLDDMLTVATDTTESEEDPEHIIKLRDVTEAVKETFKEVLSDEKDAVINNGGLYVMGTNRHESSRIDGQLRGRAGRQGDPGTSRFFLSFEDDMFVVFGGDGLQNILKTFRVSDDMPVEAPQVTDALDNVQAAVEEKYREIREQILNFDEVLNGQRQVIYSRRQKILFSSVEDTIKLMETYNEQTVADIVKAQTSENGDVDVAKVLEKIGQFFPAARPVIDEGDLAGLDSEGVAAFVRIAVDEIFKSKVAELKPESLARSANYITLVSMDNAWSEHLQAMENLKESVVFLKYMGRDIVAEYKNEAFAMFKGLEDRMRFNSIYSLWQSLLQ
uniref:SecA family profile domain-containing protein n=1 Tax=Trieres chinensis TaxID=1514140 RepID=A0A7S2ENN3_TRICV